MSDSISRKDAINIVNFECGEWAGLAKTIAKELEKLPSAQPERPTGHWKKISPAGIYECDLCGKNVKTRDIDAYDFCHGCGAKMEPKQILSEADNDTAYGGLMSAT